MLTEYVYCEARYAKRGKLHIRCSERRQALCGCNIGIDQGEVHKSDDADSPHICSHCRYIMKTRRAKANAEGE